MAIKLSEKYLDELRKGANTPNTVVELELDSGTRRFSFGRGGLITQFLADGSYVADGVTSAWGSDELPEVHPILASVSSLQNKIDTKSGYSTRGQMSFVIGGRENFSSLIADNYLKNRRVVRKDGFISPGFTYSDYAPTFTGKVYDWSRKGDELTITVADDLKDASDKIPEENSTKTQSLDFRDMHPADIMLDLLLNRLGIEAAYVDSAGFTAERDLWFPDWRFNRVLTEPKEANGYLNELQMETNSFIVHDGEKISYKVFSPPRPGSQIEEWTDSNQILQNSFGLKSGYKDNFFNRVIVYYDYDESGGDGEENFESVFIAADLASQDPSQWNEVSTKTIKSKWIRTRTHAQPSNITGVKIYHVSKSCAAGTGALVYVKAENALKWTSPGGVQGGAVTLSKDGKYQVYDQDASRYIRVVVETAGLPAADASDSITISGLRGADYAGRLATKLLIRYRDPVASASLDIDLNNVAYDSRFIKPTDIKDITTGEACGPGDPSWQKRRMMLTSVRPDMALHKVNIEAVDTRMSKRYGFIAPAGFPDYGAASAAQREYAFCGNTSNRVGGGADDGFYIW